MLSLLKRRILLLVGITLLSSCLDFQISQPQIVIAQQSPSEESPVEELVLRGVVKNLRKYQKTELGSWSDYYQDDLRVDACFKNPLGENLDNWQKALYCHTPLEYRLCMATKVVEARDLEMDRQTIFFREANLDCQE